MAVKSGHAEARRDADLRGAVDKFIFLALAANALGNRVNIFVVRVRDHEHELFPANAPANVRAARVAAQNRGELLDHGIAGGVAMGVVHGFEIVDVREDHPERADRVRPPEL